MKDETIKALKNTIIQLKKEYEILDSIIDMKDAVIDKLKAENEWLKLSERDLSRICQDFKKEIETEKSYVLKYYKTLQEIKDIAENVCRDDCPDLKFGYCIGLGECSFRARKQIIDLITKVESEET